MTDPISSSAPATHNGPNLRESLGICANQLTMTVLMTPDMANFAGNVHGGSILKLLDQVAYACAARYAGGYVVTLSVDQVTFLQTVHVGELLNLLASVNYTGRTSMEVGIKVFAEEIHTGVIRHTNSCFFTMVAVDAEGHPVPVRPLQPKTEDEQRRFRAATERRTLRAETSRRLAGTHR
jgi:acyl-CoA hydrolase